MASRGSGLVRRVAASFERLVLKREAVGTDTSGNTYYRKFEPDRDGVNIERRWVKCPGGLYDPLTIPPEWSQWLKKARGEAPTPEEVAEREMWRLRQKQRAAAIDAEEAKRKFKAASLGEQSEGSAAGGPNMDRFVQQLTGKGYAQEQSTSGSSATAGSQQQEQPAATSYPEPPPTSPPAGAGSKPAGEGQGQGDAFKPSAWTPPGS